MNEKEMLEFNRRDFLRGGSVATLMTMLGGVELMAQTNTQPVASGDLPVARIKVAVIGLGVWGREILNTLARVKQADIAAVCDNYGAMVRRSASIAPSATQTEDYKTILANPEIKTVVVATPTHLHKEIVLEAIKAGKHVYCEAPLAHNLEDAREIAKAAKANKQLVFQTGLQLRSDPQRKFLLPFIRSGALGQSVLARAQWHKKQSWRATSPNPEREKVLNWRLSKDTSLGLIGELGCHQIDQASWFLSGNPVSVSGFGSIALWKDGRDVPDTVQAMLEYPGSVYLNYDATLANSFDANYEMFYGSDAAVMLRESKAWMFKEVDSPLLGWEVYARKETFYKETGIALVANASKSTPTGEVKEEPFTNTPLWHALTNFLLNAIEVTGKAEDAKDLYADDKEGLKEFLGNIARRASAGYLEGYHATVVAIKANESILSGKRIELKPELYELS
jgi:predicted dehydrogenase